MLRPLAVAAILGLCTTPLVGCYEALEVDGDVYVFSRLDGSVCRFEKARAKLDVDAGDIDDRLPQRLLDGELIAWQTDSVTCLERANREAELIPFEDPTP